LNNQELFSGSLLENITMGNESISFQEIGRLAEIVGLKNFFDHNASGLALQIDPSGDRLPRKIVQKLLLLRALLNKPRLLLLEEPWLGLEPQYATTIKQYLLNDIPNTTVLVISNDIEFAEKANKVMIMAEGTLQLMDNFSAIQSSIKNY
jgi:ATP-binding cassette, subfamily B, bacterial